MLERIEAQIAYNKKVIEEERIMVEYDTRSEMADEAVVEIEREDRENRAGMAAETNFAQRARPSTRTPCSVQSGPFECGKPFWGVYGGQPRCKDHMPVGQCQAMSQKTGRGTQCEDRATSARYHFCSDHQAKVQHTAVYCQECRWLCPPVHPKV